MGFFRLLHRILFGGEPDSDNDLFETRVFYERLREELTTVLSEGLGPKLVELYLKANENGAAQGIVAAIGSIFGKKK